MKNLLLLIILLPNILGAQISSKPREEKIVYDMDTSCERFIRDNENVEVYFGYGFKDSTRVTINDSITKMLFLKSDSITGMVNFTLSLPKNSQTVVKFDFLTDHTTYKVFVNVNYSCIILTKRTSEWVIVYTNCTPVEE